MKIFKQFFSPQWLVTCLFTIQMVYVISAQTGQSLKFGANNSCIYFLDPVEIGVQDWCIELWFKPDASASGTSVSSHIFSTNVNDWSNTIRLSFSVDGASPHQGKLTLEVVSTPPSKQLVPQVSSGGPVINDNWHHVALVYSASANQLVLYVDGSNYTMIDKPSMPYDIVASNTATTFNSFALGTHGSTKNYSGHMDEIKIWNKAFSSQEIKNNYKYKKKQLDINNPNLLRYFDFDRDLTNTSHTRMDNVATAHTDPNGDLFEAFLIGFAPSKNPYIGYFSTDSPFPEVIIFNQNVNTCIQHTDKNMVGQIFKLDTTQKNYILDYAVIGTVASTENDYLCKPEGVIGDHSGWDYQIYEVTKNPSGKIQLGKYVGSSITERGMGSIKVTDKTDPSKNAVISKGFLFYYHGALDDNIILQGDKLYAIIEVNRGNSNHYYAASDESSVTPQGFKCEDCYAFTVPNSSLLPLPPEKPATFRKFELGTAVTPIKDSDIYMLIEADPE